MIKRVLPNTYTYKAKTTEPTEKRIEGREKILNEKIGLDSFKMSLPSAKSTEAGI